MTSLQALQAQVATLHAVGSTGPRSQRLNMVFLSEGFTQAELNNGKFADSVDAVVDYLFSKEPWNRYRSYFNIFRIEIASNESGTDNPYAVPAYSRDTYFGSGFHPVIDRLLVISSQGSSRANTLLATHVPEYDIPIVLVNDETYGGSGGPIAVASLHSLSAQLVEHEVGHSFAKLADEYDFDTPGYPAIEYPNATAKTQRSQIRWKDWIEPETSLPTPEGPDFEFSEVVGLFEGANYRSRGWYRPHDNALMKWLGLPPGAVTREAFVLNFYNRVSPLEGHSPQGLTLSVTERTPLSFSVTVKVPSEGPPLDVIWKIDGYPVGSGLTFNIASQNVGFDGKHTIIAEVKDPTPWVRRDPTGLLTEKVTWNVTLDNQEVDPAINDTPDSLLVEVGEEINLVMDATGPVPGQVGFQWSKNGKPIANAKSSVLNIPAAKLSDGGAYAVQVTGGDYKATFSADVVVVDGQTQNVICGEGKAVTLTANVVGSVTGYQWFFGDDEIEPGTEGFSGMNTAKLAISTPTVGVHEGLYSIRLTTPAGTETYDTHRVSVFNKPPVWDEDTLLPEGRVGAVYGLDGLGYQVKTQALLGRPVASFSASGLPPGLKIDSKTGIISGRPTAHKAAKNGDVIAYLVTLTAVNGIGKVSITRNLLVQPLPAGTVGSFVAVVDRSGVEGLNKGLGGRVDLVTSANGAFSGKLVLGTTSSSFKGILNSSMGSSTLQGTAIIARSGKPAPPPLELSFSIQGGTQQIEGILIDSEDEQNFTGWRNPWSKTNKADAWKGYYTFHLNTLTPPVDGLEGKGFGSFTVGADGKVKLSGRTADGETFTSACHVGSGGELMIYSLQKGKPQGSVVGRFSINDHEDLIDANNTIVGDEDLLSWWKPASTDSKARVYASGLGIVPLGITGSRYNDPSLTDPSWVVFNIPAATSDAANAAITFWGASLNAAAFSPNADVIIQAKSKATVVPDSPETKLTLSINPKLGTLTGKFSLLDDELLRSVTYQGIITNNGGSMSGEGFFLLPDLPIPFVTASKNSPIQSGLVRLIP
ncbi:M64 family metallopeptidase [Prosthecobacter debontii]|uniref:M64 family metallopeptidase n=1 Tax=Prosthecobacter debontii TaxID=48467 RepID=UPI001590525D|nr:M64 family metallopeptidase [Prosthecobacter debontii]